MGWKIAGTNAYISYDTEYSFLLGMSTSIKAEYGSSPIAKVPTVIIRASEHTGMVTFLSTRNIPAGYTFVEAGVIATKSSSPVNAADLAIGNPAGLAVFTGGSTIQNSAGGQYQYNLKSSAGSSLFARAYVIYKDSAGITHTIYSDMVNGVVQ